MPSARAYPIQQLLKDCASYFRATSRRVSFEYTLLRGVNDSPYQARSPHPFLLSKVMIIVQYYMTFFRVRRRS